MCNPFGYSGCVSGVVVTGQRIVAYCLFTLHIIFLAGAVEVSNARN